MTDEDAKAAFWREGKALYGKGRSTLLGWLLKKSGDNPHKALEAVRLASAGKDAGLFTGNAEAPAVRMIRGKPTPRRITPATATRFEWAIALYVYRLGMRWPVDLGPDPSHSACRAPEELLAMGKEALRHVRHTEQGLLL